MKQIALLVLSAFVLFSCTPTQNDEIVISGKVTTNQQSSSLVFMKLNQDGNISSDTVAVDDKGNFEFTPELPQIFYMEIINGDSKVQKAAIIMALEGVAVEVDFELKDSVLTSKEFKGINSDDLTYADSELQKLMYEEDIWMQKYIKLRKEERDSLMPDIRMQYLGLSKKSNEIFASETSPLKKKIEAFKNIMYSYDIAVIDYYDDLETTTPHAINPSEIAKVIPADSPFWEINFQLPIMVFSGYKFPATVQGYSEILKENLGYMRSMATEHPNSDVAGYTINYCLSTFLLSNDKELLNEFAAYFDTREDYGEHVKNTYDISFSPHRAIQVGNQLPQFSFISMKDENKRFTNKTFKDKIYLIDFWATWCKPCMKEMPAIHNTFEKYSKNGKFDILSISLDSSPKLVENFIKNKWGMPWKHVVLPKGKKSPKALPFEVGFIPKMILVDGKTNTILSETFFMKEGKLEEVLLQHLK